MRCISRHCNNRLEEWEATRKDKNGNYLDLCGSCLPYDPTSQAVNPRHPIITNRKTWNDNESDME